MNRKISKSYPHVCPICRGRGELTADLAQHESPAKYVLKGGNIYACHVCSGSCIIWEYREEEEEIISIPTIGISPQIGGRQITYPPQPMKIGDIQPMHEPIGNNPEWIVDPQKLQGWNFKTFTNNPNEQAAS